MVGYDTGVISGMLVVMDTDLGTVLTDWQKVRIYPCRRYHVEIALIPRK